MGNGHHSAGPDDVLGSRGWKLPSDHKLLSWNCENMDDVSGTNHLDPFTSSSHSRLGGKGRTGCPACRAEEGQRQGCPHRGGESLSWEGKGSVTRLPPQQVPASFSSVDFFLVGNPL